MERGAARVPVVSNPRGVDPLHAAGRGRHGHCAELSIFESFLRALPIPEQNCERRLHWQQATSQTGVRPAFDDSSVVFAKLVVFHSRLRTVAGAGLLRE